MPDNRIMGMNTLGTPDDNDHIEVVDVSEILPSNQNKKFSFLAFKNYVLTALAVAAHKNTHVVGGTDAFVVTDLLNAVAKVGVRINNLLTGQRRHVNFIAGTNVTITASDDNTNEKVDVTINSTVAGNVGDITGGLNVGTGEDVFLDKVANDLRFKSIDGTGIATVTTNGDVIEINVPANNGEANTGSNVGLGGRVFKIKNGVDFEHRTLNSTPSVTITENPDDLTFVANDLTTISHIGGGLQIATKTLLNTQYNTFSAGTNMNITPTLGSYVINTTAQPNSGLNLGSGQQVFKQVNTGGIPEYRTLTNGTGITLSSSSTEVNIVNSLPMISGNFIFTEVGSTIIQGVNDIINNNGKYELINKNYITTGLLFESGDFQLFGNNNKFTLTGNNKLDFTNINTYISNVVFETTTIGGRVINLGSNSINTNIFKNCTFISTTNFLEADTNGNLLFENCIFKTTLPTGSYVGLFQFGTNVPNSVIFKDCVFYYEGLGTVSYSLYSNVAITVRLIGSNYTNLPISPLITTVGNSLTIDPTLTYIV